MVLMLLSLSPCCDLVQEACHRRNENVCSQSANTSNIPNCHDSCLLEVNVREALGLRSALSADACLAAAGTIAGTWPCAYYYILTTWTVWVS